MIVERDSNFAISPASGSRVLNCSTPRAYKCPYKCQEFWRQCVINIEPEILVTNFSYLTQSITLLTCPQLPQNILRREIRTPRLRKCHCHLFGATLALVKGKWSSLSFLPSWSPWSPAASGVSSQCEVKIAVRASFFNGVKEATRKIKEIELWRKWPRAFGAGAT